MVALLDPYNREGSTSHVGFNTSQDRYETGMKCHVNFAVADSDWELEFCRVLDAHPRVVHWVKNHNLGFEVPYRAGGEARPLPPRLHRPGRDRIALRHGARRAIR